VEVRIIGVGAFLVTVGILIATLAGLINLTETKGQSCKFDCDIIEISGNPPKAVCKKGVSYE